MSCVSVSWQVDYFSWALKARMFDHVRFSLTLLPLALWRYLTKFIGNFIPNTTVKFCRSRCILIPYYHVVKVIFILDYLLLTYPWYGSVLMSGSEQVQKMMHIAPGNEGATSLSKFWVTFMRNLWHVLKSPGQRLSHNCLTAHLQNKHLSEWFLSLCHDWFPYIILCWWKLPNSELRTFVSVGVGYLVCLVSICVLICVDWNWSWWWNKMKSLAIL